MRNREKWRPSKYVFRNGKLVASRDPNEVGIGSRLIADLVADSYARNLKTHAKGRLLDLGCGKAPLYGAYGNLVTDTICVDWGNSMHASDYLDFEQDLTKKTHFEDNEFDTIILSDVLEHMPVPQDLWSEMARILSTNGKVIMNVPFYYSLHEQPHDYYRYTEFALRRFVVAAGLKLILLDRIGGAPEVIADIFSKNIVRVPGLGRPIAAFAQWLTFRFVGTPFGRRISNATSASFPLGYFLVAEKPL